MSVENVVPSLEEQLAERREGRNKRVSAETLQALDQENARIVTEGLYDRLVKVGQLAPDFSLPDVNGQPVSLPGLLSNGPLILVFYRGSWCPYCNLTLRAYQQILPQVQELGASIVAISPQTPDNSLTVVEKQELAFPVLSDSGNKVARQYGLVFQIGAEIKQFMQGVGSELAQYNGEDSWELPVPGIFVVDRDGTVHLAFADPDYTHRLEPAEALAVLRQIAGR